MIRWFMIITPDDALHARRGIQEVAINKPKDIYGTGIENDMRAGNYQVRLLPGPSFEGQKQENLESIQQSCKVILHSSDGCDLYVITAYG